MEIDIKLSVSNDNINKVDIKRILLEALFQINLDNTIKYKKIDHENNNKISLKIKRKE